MSRELEVAQDDKIEYPNNPPVTLFSPNGGPTVTDYCSAPLSRTMNARNLRPGRSSFLVPSSLGSVTMGSVADFPVIPPSVTPTMYSDGRCSPKRSRVLRTQEIKSVLCFRISNPRYPRRLFGVPRETGSVRLRQARARPCKNHAPKSSQTSPAKALISSRFFCVVWGRGLSASSYRSSPGPRKGHFSMETMCVGVLSRPSGLMAPSISHHAPKTLNPRPRLNGS
jgi:hypothetical protein